MRQQKEWQCEKRKLSPVRVAKLNLNRLEKNGNAAGVAPKYNH